MITAPGGRAAAGSAEQQYVQSMRLAALLASMLWLAPCAAVPSTQIPHAQAAQASMRTALLPRSPKGGGPCGSSPLADCSGGGDCVDGACRCDATWTGPNCEALHLLPIEADAAGWPFPNASWTVPALPTRVVDFPWGGAMAEEPAGTFHLFFTEWLNHCPMTFNTFYTSTQIAHATAPTALGPWTRQRTVVPPAAGNPALSRAPDGTWLLYYTNHRQPAAVVRSARNCSGPVSTWGKCSTNPATFPWNKSSPCASQVRKTPF